MKYTLNESKTKALPYFIKIYTIYVIQWVRRRFRPVAVIGILKAGHHRVYYLAEHLLRLCANIGLRNSLCSYEDVQKDYLQIE